jgi:hypothetical protein
MHFMGMHLMGRTSHRRASHGRASYERTSLAGLSRRPPPGMYLPPVPEPVSPPPKRLHPPASGRYPCPSRRSKHALSVPSHYNCFSRAQPAEASQGSKRVDSYSLTSRAAWIQLLVSYHRVKAVTLDPTMRLRTEMYYN